MAQVKYDVTVSREGSQWLADVTTVDGAHTYAGNLVALLQNVREVIRLVEDLTDEAAVPLALSYDDTVPEPLREAARLGFQRALLEEQTSRLARETADAVATLAAAHVPVRDIAPLVGLTPGRVSQLTKAS